MTKKSASDILPLVGVSACIKSLAGWNFHAVQDKYVDAVVDGAEAQPLLIPALGKRDIARLVARLDGVMLTGSPSNVEPHNYGAEASPRGGPHDPMRDATTLPLIDACLRQGVPILAICRGFQEMNVALGGTLHQHLQEVPGRTDHRMDRALPREEQYGPRHKVRFAPGGLLARLSAKDEAMVNSLHGQGIDRLGQGLIVEATAADGTIEAVRVDGAANFALGVQWHAEWRVKDNALSAAIFAEFGRRVAERARRALRARRNDEGGAAARRHHLSPVGA